MPELFPLTPHFIDSFETEAVVEIKKYRNGKEQRIELAPATTSYEVSWEYIDSVEKGVIETFFDTVGATRDAFNFHNHHSDKTVLVRFTEPKLKFDTTLVDIYSITFTLKEVSA